MENSRCEGWCSRGSWRNGHGSYKYLTHNDENDGPRVLEHK